MKLFGLFSRSKNKDAKKEISHSPKNEAVWIDGFSAGYQAAFSTLAPILSEGNKKLYQAIREQAIEETLARFRDGNSSKTVL